MNWQQILNRMATRVTGVSTPFFGIQWTPATSDVEVARRVLTFLEDRRVFYDPYQLEVPEHCVASVLQIREFLTVVLAEQGIATELDEHLRAMRAACRSFLRWFGNNPDDLSTLYVPSENGLRNWQLNQALGELRAVFGSHIGEIAVRYQLDVERPLSYLVEVAYPADQSP